MIKLFSALLLAVYLINEQVGMPSLVVSVVTMLLYFFAFIYSKKKYNTLTSLIFMMVISLPFSWNPFWGGRVGSSIITWFYLWSGITIVYMLFEGKLRISRKNKVFVFACMAALLYSPIPLLMSRSFSEGIKEFIMINFFVVIIIVALSKKIQCSEKEIDGITDVYIFTMFITAAAMIIQFIGFRVLGMTLFGFKLMYSYGGEIQTGCHLLMEDASSGTIMLGVGAMFALINRKKSKIYYIEAAIIIIGLACSGRRTGAVTLLFVMAVYYTLGVKRLADKMKMIIVFGALGVVLLNFMSASRAITNVQQLLYDNGRFQLWSEGFELFKKRPILGYGYDNTYLASLMPSRMIVHNTVLRWLDMGGILYGFLLVLIFVVLMLKAREREMDIFFWSILYACIAGLLIPDVLNARFFYVLGLLVLLNKKEDTAMDGNG